jgi:prepilin-type N-terminal cleavage/methylation domain-containing protein
MRPWVQSMSRRVRTSNGRHKPKALFRNRRPAIRNPLPGFTLIELLLVLVILATLAAIVTPTSNADGWQQPYLKSGIPLDPWGGDYIYKYPGQYNQDSYDLYSYGPDQKMGGDDDIVNWSKEQTR